MSFKLKQKDGKAILEARDEVQVAAILKNGFEFASKAEEDKFKKLKEPKKD